MISMREWTLSLAGHLALSLGVLLVIWLIPQADRDPRPDTPVTVQIIEAPAPVPPEKVQAIELSKPKKEPARQAQEAQPVFGLSKDTLTADPGQSAGVQVKEGNTIAKEIDQTPAVDTNALPVPTDDFLVTAMPRVLSEVRAEYPAEARSRGIEGPVVLELLIDDQGVVRDARVIDGPGAGLNEAAQAALLRFRFAPAMVDQKAVSVKIRYTYRFRLR
jgi:protein TonB